MHIQATTSQKPHFFREDIQIDYEQIAFPDNYDKAAFQEQLEQLLRHKKVLNLFQTAMIGRHFTMVKKKEVGRLLNVSEVKVPTIVFYKRETDLQPKVYALFNKAIKIGGSKIVKKMTPLEKDGLSYVEIVPKNRTKPHRNNFDFLKEWTISKQLLQQKIESIVHVNWVSWDNTARLIAEYYPFGSLTDYIDQLEISSIYPGFECLDVIVQLVTILESLHTHGFCHLDLKMPNIFVKPDGGQYKVAIGDLATISHTSSENVVVLTTFPPPEIHAYDKITPYPAIDLWGLGLILSYLKNRKFCEPPFRFDQMYWGTGKEAVESHLKTLHEEQHPWNPLIIKLLSHNKDERPSATEVKNFFVNEMKTSSTFTTNRDRDLEK